MVKELPAFQIEVIESASQSGKVMTHRLAIDTLRICNGICAIIDIKEVCLENPAAGDHNDARKMFYSSLALQLSMLSNQQLLDNFSQLRVCFKQTRLVKNYQFRFEY